MNSATNDFIWEQIWRLFALKRKHDVGQIPYNLLLKAILISLSYYDNEKLHFLLCIHVMNIVSQPE